jgi:hypothetical protein
MNSRELAIATPLVFLAIVFGVYPQSLFDYVTPSVNHQVETLAAWTRDVHDADVRDANGESDIEQTAHQAAVDHVADNSGVTTP